MTKIKIIQANVEEDLVVKEVPAGLETMQGIVGGYIECVRFHSNIDLWINEEGLLIDLPLNFITVVVEDNVPKPIHQIMGNAFFASHDEEGNTVSLNDLQVQQIKKMFDFNRKYCIVR